MEYILKACCAVFYKNLKKCLFSEHAMYGSLISVYAPTVSKGLRTTELTHMYEFHIYTFKIFIRSAPTSDLFLLIGIRLTPTSVITSTANGSTQMLYVVPTITSNSNGQQKVAFVNFQRKYFISNVSYWKKFILNY